MDILFVGQELQPVAPIWSVHLVHTNGPTSTIVYFFTPGTCQQQSIMIQPDQSTWHVKVIAKVLAVTIDQGESKAMSTEAKLAAMNTIANSSIATTIKLLNANNCNHTIWSYH